MNTSALTPLREYITERVVPGIHWYEKHGDRAERWYLFMQATAVIFGAAVPVLVNVAMPPMTIITTILSLIVVVLVALEGVLHFRDRYRNYRSTAHALEQECFLLLSGAPPYDKCNRTTQASQLYAKFVKNTEAYVGKEVDSTLKIMTVSSAEKEGIPPNGGTQQGTQQPGTK